MTMTLLAGLVAGAGFGLGLVLLVRALWPGPVPLAAVMADVQRPRTTTAAAAPGGGGWRLRMVGLLDTLGLVDTGVLRTRLRILDVTAEQHITHKVTLGVAGFTLPLLTAAAAGMAGVSVPLPVTAVAGVGFGALGFWWPDLGLTDRAAERRRGFRHALSAYLDLVTVILAGGGGLETALHTAADAGDGWAFAEIRRGLGRARFTGQTPWEVFDDLGRELGVDELCELASSAHLAGNQGARIQASLTAKADTLRAHQTAAIEAEAEASTEKMLLPVVGLVVGMILFIGFGVVEAISTDPTALTPPP